MIPSAEHSDRGMEMYLKRIEIDVPLLLLSNMPPLVVFLNFFSLKYTPTFSAIDCVHADLETKAEAEEE